MLPYLPYIYLLWVKAAAGEEQCGNYLVSKLNNIREEIANLTDLRQKIADLEARLEWLEQDISFSVVTSVHLYDLDDDPAIFNTIKHNNGQGYDGSTGMIIEVPEGGGFPILHAVYCRGAIFGKFCFG